VLFILKIIYIYTTLGGEIVSIDTINLEVNQGDDHEFTFELSNVDSDEPMDLTLIIRAVKPPSLNGSFMLGGGGAVISIRVPAESVQAYKSAANWSNYAPIISAI
jgi:hypothetical protein